MCRVLALRGMLDLVNNIDYPGRSLVMYFLGTSRRIFVEDPPTGPTIVQLTKFYRYVTTALNSVKEALPDVDIKQAAASRVCEWLAVTQLDTNQLAQCRTPRWHSLTSHVLPPDVRDFGWERGWKVLPTRERLAAWGVTPSSSCPQCGQLETLEHALSECLVARTFGGASGACSVSA